MFSRSETYKFLFFSQAVCVQLDAVNAAVCPLEDRGRHLTEQELQLKNLSEFSHQSIDLFSPEQTLSVCMVFDAF